MARRCTTACAAVLATKMPIQKAEASAPTAKALAPSAVSVSASRVSTTNSAATNRKYTPGISHSAGGNAAGVAAVLAADCGGLRGCMAVRGPPVSPSGITQWRSACSAISTPMSTGWCSM